jgi:hypothetical protein
MIGRTMTTIVRQAAGTVALAAIVTLASIGDGRAAPIAVGRSIASGPGVALAQYGPSNKSFRKCMRAKYGPRYFARVPRAHRYTMAQACGA